MKNLCNETRCWHLHFNEHLYCTWLWRVFYMRLKFLNGNSLQIINILICHEYYFKIFIWIYVWLFCETLKCRRYCDFICRNAPFMSDAYRRFSSIFLWGFLGFYGFKFHWFFLWPPSIWFPPKLREEMSENPSISNRHPKKNLM